MSKSPSRLEMFRNIFARPRQSCRSHRPNPLLLWYAVAAITLSLFVPAPTLAQAKKKTTARKSSNATPVDLIHRILGRSELKGASFGVHVVRLSNGQTLYERQIDRLLIPASNAKLFTTAAALIELGADFEYRTVVGQAGHDLVVVGAGDPTIGGRFTGGDPTVYFRRWAALLKQQKISRIEGDILLDDSMFDRQFVHPDWSKNDLGHWYAAPVAALVLNDSCIDVHVGPGAKAGERGQATLVPPCPLFQLQNRTQTVTAPKEHAPRVVRAPGSSTVRCDGGVLLKASTITAWLPVDDPVEYFGSVLASILRAEGITISGGVKSAPGARNKPGFQPRLVHRFPLLPILEVTNKESQNLYAEQLLKTIGAANQRGSWPEGAKAIGQAIGRLGVDQKGYVIADGCGLSRSNRASPRAFTQLLAGMHGSSHGTHFRETLSIAGVDGTLKKRMGDEPYRGRIWAKTGSIAGVRSISGYVQTRTGEWLAFSFLANDVKFSLRTVQDDFCRVLVNWNDTAQANRAAAGRKKK